MPVLAVLVPGPVEVDGGTIRTASKTISGMEAFAQYWPGDVVHVTEASHAGSSTQLGVVSRRIDDLPYAVSVTHDRLGHLAELRPDVVLVNLSLSELPLLKFRGSPIVINVENDLRNRVRWASLGETARDLPKVIAGLLRLEAKYINALQGAAGLQANGWPAWTSYRRFNRHPMLYFDSRMRSDQIVSPKEKMCLRSRGQGFTYGFSGRWIEQKGFHEALRAFRRAREADETLTLHLMGSGPLDVPADLREGLQILGALDFEKGWIPHVRQEIDAMLLPYPQSDPAGTYLEGVSCGAPFVAFQNRQAEELARRGLGWTSPMGDIEQLANQMSQVVGSSTALAQARAEGYSFMLKHTMEREFERRSAHLLDCARLRG